MTKFHLTFFDLFMLITFAAACVFWGQTANMKDGSEVYPRLVSVLLAVLAIVCFFQERLASSEKINFKSSGSMKKPLIMIAGVAVYILCITKVGYFVSTYTYLLVMFQSNRWGNKDEFLETKPLITDSLISLCVTGMIGLVFKIALSLVFPESWLF